MSSSIQEKVSRLHHDSAYFKWRIENFSIEKSLKNEDDFLESPPYKYSNIDWKLKLRRSSENLELFLSLSPHLIKDLSRLSSCEFHFFKSGDVEGYKATYEKPISVLETYIPIDLLKEKCVADGVLTVSCELTMEKLIDVQSTTETITSVKEKSLHQGLATLAENIESIMDDSELSDVTLKADKDTFQAHKVILSSRSKVFEGMFKSGMKESQEGVVTMVDMKSSIVKEMLYYIYTGKIEKLSMHRAMDLYTAADAYDLQELKTWCKDFITEGISAEDVCSVAILAELYEDDGLTRAAKRVFKQEYKTLMKSQTWREFSQNSPSVYMDLVESTMLSES